MSTAESCERLDGLASDYWQFECDEYPFTAIMAGADTKADALLRESATDHERRARKGAELRAALGRIATDKLNPQEHATWRMLEHDLALLSDTIVTEAHRRLSLFPAGPEFMAVSYANMTTLADSNAAARYVARLASLPSYLDDVGANLRAGYESGIRYPEAILERAAANVRAIVATPIEQSPWMRPFATAVAPWLRVSTEAERVRALVDQALRPALARYLDLLEGPLSAGARKTLSCVDAPGGRDYYQMQVRRFTTMSLAPETIHQRGLEEVARLTEAIEQIAAGAGYAGRLQQYRRSLEQDPQFLAPSAQALRERAECVAKRIDMRIPAFFSRIPRMTYGVETIPEAASVRMPPAYAQPNPADGSGAGVFWLTALPQRCPLYSLPAFTLHEAWPGHLMYIALVQEMDALPQFRRHGSLKYSACLEGWAVYCEFLGVEMGVYETPHEEFGRLNSELWRAARMVVDTGIHWHGWTREQALEYLSAHVSLSPDTVAAEVDRYAGLPAQALGYHLGSSTIRGLRLDAERALGSRFSLRRFHGAVTDAGPVTLPVLEYLVEDWVARQQPIKLNRVQQGGPPTHRDESP